MKRYLSANDSASAERPGQAAALGSPCPSGVDPSVWAELPLDIRVEYIQSLPTDCAGSAKKIRAATKCAVEVHSRRTLIPSMFKLKSDKAEEDYFTDGDFLPSAGSIDGRGSQVDELSALKCHCQKAARVRQVSKAGINQGRHFYSCGAVSRSIEQGCKFFAWAENAPHSERAKRIQWRRFNGDDGWCFVHPARGFRAEDVLQGGVGNCWFLSAVAVISERQDLMEKILLSESFMENGSSKFRYFLDGAWCDVEVDNFLPCRHGPSGTAKGPKGQSELYFAKAKLSQLWVPFLEKSYAKLYGSYEAISGGFISEALLDLACAPCETISFFSDSFDSEETWDRLVSFNNCKFPMGCSTDSTGEGIVGNHAYSILDVRQIAEAKLGTQSKLKTYFYNNSKMTKSTMQSKCHSYGVTADHDFLAEILPPDILAEVLDLFPQRDTECSSGDSNSLRSHDLRLIRIRNPWGKQEWSGAMSKSSSMWTTKLLSKLEAGSKNDGTFWMFYHDFLRRFSSIDVCKCFVDSAGWSRMIRQCTTVPGSFCASTQFQFVVNSFTWVYLFVTQKTKRGRNRTNADKEYWYSDISIVVSSADGSKILGASFSGQRRDTIPLELHLEEGSYNVHLFHFSPHNRRQSSSDSFSLIAYSSRPDVELIESTNGHCLDRTDAAALLLFKGCLRNTINIQPGSSCQALSKESYLKYASRDAVHSFNEKTSLVGGVDVISLDGGLSDCPMLHILHGAGDMLLVVLVNMTALSVATSFDMVLSSQCRITSPYVSSTEAVSEGRLKRIEFRTKCRCFTSVCIAAIFENAFTVESGRRIEINISNCVYHPCITANESGTPLDCSIPEQFSEFSMLT